MIKTTRAQRIENANRKANAAGVRITTEMWAQWARGGHSRDNARDIGNRAGVAAGRMYAALTGGRKF